MTSIVEVGPPSFLRSRARLFEVVGRAMDVTFTSDTYNASALMGRVVVGEVWSEDDVPTLALGPGSGSRVTLATVELLDTRSTDPYLPGWAIEDRQILGTTALSPTGRDEVLATAGGQPIWLVGRQAGRIVHRSTLPPAELSEDGTLFSRLSPGRFFDLLPLIHFLRSLATPNAWMPPQVMASFVMDDPNLHHGRYGYLDLREWVGRASGHLTLATVPFDGWFSNGRTVDLVRANPHRVSLMIHGNNHTRHELDDGRDDESRLRMLAQSLKRARRLAESTGIPIAEVMAAPHGRCSSESSDDMARLGFESLCISHPFPWFDRPPGTHPLAGWAPADTSTSMPALPRLPLTAQPEELPLRAFLRQPVVVFGHHWDLADRPELLDEWANQVDRLSGVQWSSVGRISRAMFSTRLQDDVIQVRPHTRVVEVAVPETASTIEIDVPPLPGYDLVEVTAASQTLRLPAAEAVASVPGGASAIIRLVSQGSVEPSVVPNPSWSPWPATRRLLTEARDRLRPLVDKVSRQ